MLELNHKFYIFQDKFFWQSRGYLGREESGGKEKTKEELNYAGALKMESRSWMQETIKSWFHQN